MSAVARLFADRRPAPDIAAGVRAVVDQHSNKSKPALGDEARLASDHGLDLLARWDLLVAIEDRFNIEIDDDAWLKVETVGDLIRLVEGRTKP